jgi:outer membrane protein assembly factor BamB
MYRSGKQEVAISLDAKTGKTLWEYKYESMPIKGHHADYGNGPNATPLLSDGRLYTIGIAGLMHCLDAANGKLLWSHNLWFDYKALPVNEFGYSSSPIAHKDMVIAQMGGGGQSLAAFDAKDGRIVWKGLDYPTTFSTPKIMRLSGQDQAVVCTADGVIGVDPNTGKLLWRYPVVNREKQNITMPIRLDSEELFFSTWEAGSRRLRLVKRVSRVPPRSGEGLGLDSSGGFRVEEVWSERQPQFMYVSCVRFDDYIYGSSGTNVSAAISAVNVQTGKLAWRKRGFGLAHVVAVGKHLIMLDDQGALGFATPSPEGLTVRAKVKLLQAPSRTAPTVVGKTLYVRDMHNIMALDLG